MRKYWSAYVFSFVLIVIFCFAGYRYGFANQGAPYVAGASAASMNGNLAEGINLFMDQYRTAYESGDINRFMSLYSKSAVENGIKYDDIRRSYQKNFETGRYTYILRNPQIQKNDDNIIILTGAYSIVRIGETQAVSGGNIRWTLVRESGALKIVKAEY